MIPKYEPFQFGELNLLQSEGKNSWFADLGKDNDVLKDIFQFLLKNFFDLIN